MITVDRRECRNYGRNFYPAIVVCLNFSQVIDNAAGRCFAIGCIIPYRYLVDEGVLWSATLINSAAGSPHTQRMRASWAVQACCQQEPLPLAPPQASTTCAIAPPWQIVHRAENALAAFSSATVAVRAELATNETHNQNTRGLAAYNSAPPLRG